MNSWTTLTFVAAADGAPRVSMAGGEVYVEVADADHGFAVETQQGTAVDLGTEFAVKAMASTCRVTVVEGSVEASTDVGAVLVAAMQETVLVGRSSVPGPVQTASDLQNRFSWARGPAPANSLRRGLVAYWPLDESHGSHAYNAMGRGLIGQIQGAARTTGRLGPCLQFSPSKSVFVPDAEQLGESCEEITVAAWVLLDENRPEGMKIVSRRNPADAGIPVGFELDVIDGKVRLLLVDAAGGCHGVWHTPGGRVLDCGRWYHVAGTCSLRDGLTRTYVDGSLDREAKVRFAPPVIRGPLALGRPSTGAAFPWRGKIDEVVVYLRALNPDEVRDLAARTRGR